MIFKDILEVSAELSALIEASATEEVLIVKAGVPVAKLVRATGSAMTRMPGALKGQITIREDFKELPSNIAAVLGVEP